METLDDSALLRQYCERHSEDAFAALVARHINLVYSVALRQVGNPHHAEEITQAVFIILAQKAGGLRHNRALSSWLFQTTHLTGKNFIRSEMRRHHREQEAYMQSIPEDDRSTLWDKIAPLLDSAVAALSETDRRAVVLRFYEGRSAREIGVALGTSEDAAKKRVSRALEKLQRIFLKRGVSSTAGTIGDTISANSVCAAPVALAGIVRSVAATKGAAASTSTLTLIKGALKLMAWTKAKTAVYVGVGVLIVVGTTLTAVKVLPHGSDLQSIQGTWSGHENGLRGASSLVLQGTNINFRGARPGEWYKATISLREDTSPKQCVVVIADCPAPKFVGKTSYGIYKIQNDTLTITANEPGNPVTPGTFQDRSARTMVFKRN